MAHGYLGDGYGKYGDRDPDGGRDEDRRGDWRGEWRGEQPGRWRDRDREDEYRGQRRGEPDRGWPERDRGFMFEGRGDRGDDEGFFSRTADQARDWFRQDEHDYRPERPYQGRGRPQGQQGSRFGSHQDDHYLSWRQQQMDALDRDYQDYCRERQQQFHQDFDSWRSSRPPRSAGGGSQPSGAAMGQQPGELELTAQHDMAGRSGGSTDPSNAQGSTTAPESSATLGTNNSENSTTGRRR
jgi:hypothetical protein